MECDPRSSAGSTVSGGFNTIFKTKNPIGYIYISHPFGTLGSPQKIYNSNFKVLQIESPVIRQEENKMNIRCTEYYRGKNRTYKNTDNDINSVQDQIKENAANNYYIIPEFKYVIDSIRKAWKPSMMPLQYEPRIDIEPRRQYLKNNSQEDETIQTGLITPKKIIRRYSLPETAIRKYKFMYEQHSNTKYLNNKHYNLPLNSKTNNKYHQYSNKLNSQNQSKQLITSVSYLDLISNNNIDTPVDKPLTMPSSLEVKRKKYCFYCSSKKNNNSIEKNEEITKKVTNSSSDIFISDLLIRNLNEDMAIAEILINNIDNDQDNNCQKDMQKKHHISSIYVSPDRLIGIANTNKQVKTYQSSTDINVKSSEEPHLFVKENSNNILTNTNEYITSMINTKNEFTKISTNDQLPILPKRPESTIISSALSLSNSPDNDAHSKSEMEIKLPIESNKINNTQTNSMCEQIKFRNFKIDNNNVLLTKREKINLATIQTNLKHQFIDSEIQRVDNNFKIPIIEELIKTPFKNHNPRNKQRTFSKSILNSLEAYTFDSGGNISFRVLSSAISQHEPAPIESGCSAKYVVPKNNINENNFRKITIFEAQSNMVTPDNDNGPKRFYQKTEILNGDKKIDILEIVECMQNAMDYKQNSEFNKKLSKIPIPIDKFKFIKKQKNRYARSIAQPKLSKIEISEKQKEDQKYKENIHENNMLKLIYPVENVAKYTPKINSKIQAVKPLRPLINNIKNQLAPNKNYNFSGEDQKDQYSTTGAYISSITDDSLQNTITPSSGTAIHGSTSHNRNLSDEFSNQTDSPSFSRVNKIPCINKLHTTSNLNSHNRLQKTKLETRQLCQYDLVNSSDYIRQNKFNAWRIPSSDIYEKIKPNIEMPRIFPRTSNTESTIKCKTSCNNNCQFCTCYNNFTPNSRIIYSPTQSVCSLCSKIYNSTRLPSCNTECSVRNKNISNNPLSTCNDKDIYHCNKDCKNAVCECMVENSNISYLCNQQRTAQLCQYSKCSKIDDIIFPEGILSNSQLDFSAEGLVTSSSSIADSNWKSQDRQLSCNWKSNNIQSKTCNITAETKRSTQKNTNSQPGWTVTVTTKCLQQASDLKMKFKFPQPPTELCIENDFSDNEENDNFSLGSVNSAKKTTNQTFSEKPSCERYYAETNNNITDGNIENCYDNDFKGYSLNLTSLLSKRNCENLKQDSKNLSVMGNAIAPEQKPRVQTMSERDLTRRRYQKTFNNFSMRNNF